MKAEMGFPFITLRGKQGKVTYYTMKNSTRIIVRSLPKKFDSPQKQAVTAISQRFKCLFPSAGYKADLREYIQRYRKLRISNPVNYRCWSNVLYNLMYEMVRLYPASCDLTTITKAQIYADNLPCISVKAAVEASVLRAVKDYAELDEQI